MCWHDGYTLDHRKEKLRARDLFFAFHSSSLLGAAYGTFLSHKLVGNMFSRHASVKTVGVLLSQLVCWRISYFPILVLSGRATLCVCVCVWPRTSGCQRSGCACRYISVSLPVSVSVSVFQSLSPSLSLSIIPVCVSMSISISMYTYVLTRCLGRCVLCSSEISVYMYRASSFFFVC